MAENKEEPAYDTSDALFGVLTGTSSQLRRNASTASRSSLGVRSSRASLRGMGSRVGSMSSRAMLKGAGDEVLNPYVIADTAMEVLLELQGNEQDRYLKQLQKLYRQPLGIQLTLALLNHIRPRGWTNRVTNKNGVEETLSVAYGRVVLVCSNFKYSKADREFFETLYMYMDAIMRIIAPKAEWPHHIQELHQLIRGHAENPNGVDHRNAEQLRPLQNAATHLDEPYPKLHCIPRFGQKMARKDTVEKVCENVRRTSAMRLSTMQRLEAKKVLRETEKANLQQQANNSNRASRLYDMLWSRSPLLTKVLPLPHESLNNGVSKSQSAAAGRDDDHQKESLSGVITGFSSPKRSRAVRDVEEQNVEGDLQFPKILPPNYLQDLVAPQRIHSKFRKILRERRKLHNDAQGLQRYVSPSMLVSPAEGGRYQANDDEQSDWTETGAMVENGVELDSSNHVVRLLPKHFVGLREWRDKLRSKGRHSEELSEASQE